MKFTYLPTYTINTNDFGGDMTFTNTQKLLATTSFLSRYGYEYTVTRNELEGFMVVNEEILIPSSYNIELSNY